MNSDLSLNWWPIIYLGKFHVKWSQETIVRGEILLELWKLAYSKPVFGQVRVLLENLSFGCEINEFQQLVEIEIKVS